MATIILGSGGGGRGSVGALDNLYVRGDDDGLWYTAGLTLDPTFGVYLWQTGSYGSSVPDNTVNISDRLVGSAFFMRDNDHVWHRFNMTATDEIVPGFVWTDADQFSTPEPSVFRIRRNFRADDGLYILDERGSQIHKMGISGGMWSELTQGYTIPL